MNVKKAIKKIVAIGTGAALVGTTVLSAAAADLSSFPEPFVKDGMWNNIIVVGESAQTPDVIGAVDIATTLQYEMKEQLSGASGTSTTVTYVGGDSLEISTSNDPLQMGETLGTILDDELDTEDFAILSDDNEFDDEDYEETLLLNKGKIVFEESDSEDYDEEIGNYLLFNENDVVYTYTLDFESPDSDVDTEDLVEDWEDEEIVMMGESYTVTSATYNSGTNKVEMELVGGSVTSEFVTTDEALTVEYDGVEYEVSLERVDEDDAEASFIVSGYRTGSVDVGDSYEIDELGIKIFVKDVYEYDAPEPDVAEFYIGADTVVLSDVINDTTGSIVTIADEDYDGVTVSIQGSGDASSVSLDKIVFTVTAGADYYLAPGDKLSDFYGGNEYEDTDYLFGNVDFLFGGMDEQSTQEIALTASGDNTYTLSFETYAGVEYDLDVLYTDGTSDSDKTYELGASDGDLFITAKSLGDVATANLGGSSATFNVTSGDSELTQYLEKGSDVVMIVNEEADPLDSDVAFVEFSSYDGTDSVTFTDVGSDETYKVDMYLSNATGVYTGKLKFEGNDFVVVWDTDDKGNIFVDNVGTDIAPSNTYVIPLDSEAYMTLNTSGSYDDLTVNVTVPGDLYEDSTDKDEVIFSIQSDTTDTEEIDLVTPVTKDFVTGSQVALTGYEVEDDVDEYMTMYGTTVFVDSDSEEVTINIPYSQVYPSVALISGEVEQSSITSGAEGAGYSINAAGVGVAQLDTEVSSWKTKNVIVVGGPCVNTIAAELKGNNEDCTEGFTAGTAVVELSGSSNVAMLVAGYNADDTRLAASVVHNFRNYDEFQGSSIEVSGTSLSSVSITSVE